MNVIHADILSNRCLCFRLILREKTRDIFPWRWYMWMWKRKMRCRCIGNIGLGTDLIWLQNAAFSWRLTMAFQRYRRHQPDGTPVMISFWSSSWFILTRTGLARILSRQARIFCGFSAENSSWKKLSFYILLLTVIIASHAWIILESAKYGVTHSQKTTT